jgi:hypothetical protein
MGAYHGTNDLQQQLNHRMIAGYGTDAVQGGLPYQSERFRGFPLACSERRMLL